MPTVALHQKYRPKTLAELVGQPYVQTALTNAINYQQIAPAYLFTGSRGTGKISTARIFAKSLNCLNADKSTTEPCGLCQSCRSIETSNSLDVSEIDAAKPTSQKLLTHAKLINLQDSQVLLEVSPTYLKKFEANKDVIARMLQRAIKIQKPITVSFKTVNLSTNWRATA